MYVFGLIYLTWFVNNHNVISSDQLHTADVWADALNAFIDHNLWSIQDTQKLLMPEIIQFKGH